MENLTLEEIDQRLEELGEPTGIAVHCYLPNLTDSDCKFLLTVGKKIERVALALGCWMSVIALRELYRRGSLEPIEADYPMLPANWADSDYCAALKAMAGVEYAIRDDGLDVFFGKLNRLLVVIVCDRLTKQSAK